VTAPWRTFAIASVAVFLVSLDVTVLYAAFPALRRAFPSATAADLSWVLNAYTVVYAALLVPAGRLADLRGRKQIFVTGIALFIVASFACGLAPSADVLVAARVVQAMGAALLLPTSLAIVLAAFPVAKRSVAVSLWGAVAGLAAAVGPSLGTLLVDHFGWESAFFINVPIGGYALYRAVTTLEESKNPEAGAPLDLVGIALLIAGIGAVAFGLVSSEASGWSSVRVIAALVFGSVALAAFVAWARHAAAPAIDLSLFAHRTYRYVNLATLSFGIAFAMMFFSVFQFFTGVWGYSLSQAGVAAAPGPLLVIPTSIVCGRIAARAGHRALLVGGSLVFGASAVWTFTVPGVEPSYLTWFPGLVLSGIGVGMVLPSLSAAAVAHLPAARFGIGSAVNQAVRQVGAVLGVALAIVLIGRSPTLASFQTVFHWQLGLALLTAVFVWPVDTRPR
jgi:EmrB/QacA subfamily drug resistance transporter